MKEQHPDHAWAMADVSAKPITHRLALATGTILIGADAMKLLQANALPKGDPLAMAELAGILGAKETPRLIPLCHPIALNRVALRSRVRSDANAIDVYCFAEIAERTGVEMEALTGLNIALLTIWDLVKPVNAALEITGVRLLYKSGGKRGTWIHPDGLSEEAKALIEEFTAA